MKLNMIELWLLYHFVYFVLFLLVQSHLFESVLLSNEPCSFFSHHSLCFSNLIL